jgi:hypothetical protein
MKGPKTYDEYVDLAHQAVYEVDEMRAGLDYDPENAERWSAMLDHLDGVLRVPHRQGLALHAVRQSLGTRDPLQAVVAGDQRGPQERVVA